MKKIEWTGSSGSCTIMLGTSITRLSDFCNIEKTVIITDEHVYSLYNKLFSQYKIFVMKVGEQYKTLDTVNEIYERFFDYRCDRTWFVVGIGGGVVCDVAGFAASTYLRGLPFGFVPTTLLAQVDASVGGKNGVNYKGYKNLIGTINQPRFVLCDFNVLKTLAPAELKNGFAEAIKDALIGDKSLLMLLEKYHKDALSLDEKIIENIVYKSLKVKISIVSRDEKESDERRKLNFGHTLGHALEKAKGLKHGEAISVGMLMEMYFTEKKCFLHKTELERIKQIFKVFDLPVAIKCDREIIMDAIMKDKKIEDQYIYIILLEKIGKAKVEKKYIDELKEMW